MRIMVNTTTLNRGGALQASISFILEAVKAGDNVDWHFVMSRESYDELTRFAVDADALNIRIIEPTPARNLNSRKSLLALERNIVPDAVFTFFGPAYVNFSTRHLCGVADGWVTHSGRLAFSRLSTMEKIEFALRIARKAYWYRKADAWVVEAETTRSGLAGRCLVPRERIFVVPNNCGGHYLEKEETIRFPSGDEKLRILCFSASYPHKNLDIMPYVVHEIRKRRPDLPFEFVLTLPADSVDYRFIEAKARELGVSEHFVNVGVVPVIEGPDLYRGCHMAFVPTLLESFTANYPEAMAMARPIVTPDLPFSRDICRDAALFYEAKNPVAAAGAILSLVDERRTWERIVTNGVTVLAQLPTPRQKYESYLKILSVLSQGNLC